MSEIKSFIQQVAEMTKNHGTPDGWFYSNLYELVLMEGYNFPLERISFPMSSRQGNQQCFMNCFLQVMTKPNRYTYCEGYALGCVIPVHHAWIWDKDACKVIDPTWKESSGYYGVPIQLDYVMKRMLDSGKVFDCWEERWPTMKAEPREYVQTTGMSGIWEQQGEEQ
jgi:hypothetical protein